MKKLLFFLFLYASGTTIMHAQYDPTSYRWKASLQINNYYPIMLKQIFGTPVHHSFSPGITAGIAYKGADDILGMDRLSFWYGTAFHYFHPSVSYRLDEYKHVYTFARYAWDFSLQAEYSASRWTPKAGLAINVLSFFRIRTPYRFQIYEQDELIYDDKSSSKQSRIPGYMFSFMAGLEYQIGNGWSAGMEINAGSNAVNLSNAISNPGYLSVFYITTGIFYHF